jgi:hypothetical protein
MRILRGLSSRFLPCGCVAGIYETYDGLIIAVIDAHGSSCDNNRHGGGKVLPVDAEEMAAGVRSTSSALR